MIQDGDKVVELMARGKGMVRIPLDYYRILGLPIQATADQLQQAHRDRTLQLPRREFSEVAIAARRELIDEAYAVLANPVQRQDYDASFLAKSYDLVETGRGLEESPLPSPLGQSPLGQADANGTDPYTPSIEIRESQFIGALLILQEMGEYELVLQLGRPFLNGGHQALKNGQFGDPNIVAADIVLTIALACLELGREQWQQSQYENAAASLETGQELLLREGLFANIRGEMQSDLFKLRPYRILELLALPEAHDVERSQGLILLKDMLRERGGIDGGGDDQSGLNVDDFLRFIQQLRTYLTVAEQQTLFELEARRPSAVATYLAVYSLLARGFAQRQPSLIRRAKQLLMRLSNRQDVHLEQAVCALLLGQTEEASRALELSQEFDSLGFIREHSQGSPDLLPGLCLYSERWLQTEVFQHFRDLSRKKASLKDYFADEDVQAYLEELPNDGDGLDGTEPPLHAAARSNNDPPRFQVTMPGVERRQDRRQNDSGKHTALGTPGQGSGRQIAIIDAPDYGNVPSSNGRDSGSNGHLSSSAERLPSNGYASSRTDASGASVLGSPLARRPQDAPLSAAAAAEDYLARRQRGRRSSFRWDRLLLVVAGGLLGLFVIAFCLSKLWGSRTPSAPAATASETPSPIGQLKPTVDQVAAAASTGSTTAEVLTKENAQQLIQTWLTAKAASMGEAHSVDQLNTILTDAALTQWQSRAEQEKSRGSYVTYEHSNLEVTDVQPSTDNPNVVQVDANVTEKIQPYANGQPDLAAASADDLRVRYTLVRQDGQWRIQSMALQP